MPASQADEIDWENLSNKELHDKLQQMISGQVEDVLNRFEEAMEKIDGIEKAFKTKLDNKFNELLAHLPQPPPAAPLAPRSTYIYVVRLTLPRNRSIQALRVLTTSVADHRLLLGKNW